MAYKKTPLEKFQTKLKNVLVENDAKEVNKKIKIEKTVFFQYSKLQIKYFKKRYYPSRKIDIVEEDFEVIIPLNHENLTIFSSNAINPPAGAKRIVDLFKYATGNPFDSIVLGAKENKLVTTKIHITKDLYDIIVKIDKEEGRERNVRVNNRISPFMEAQYKLTLPNVNLNKDYSLLLKEIIASGQITKADVISLTSNLESGEANQVIIEKQVTKQVKWLIETIESIVEEKDLTVAKAKELGHTLFSFNKIDIIGPEQLMEMILTKYGQYTLFGVPALLNTNKYVNHATLSRSQFDLILITHLGDIEVVELKRPDQKILDYDSQRGKFYPSKDLSIAISQAERYISAVNKDNDDEYKIDGKKIRQFISDEIGGILYVEAVRPAAIIIIGSWATVSKDYSKLNAETKSKVSKQDYDDNGLRAYRELKSSFRNIKLLNYSELLEHARTRLELMK